MIHFVYYRGTPHKITQVSPRGWSIPTEATRLHSTALLRYSALRVRSIRMASHTITTEPGLPPDLFDQTTLISLASTVAILLVAYGASLKALSSSTPGSYRFLFIWHAFDALVHFFLEGSFLYHVSPSFPLWLLRWLTHLCVAVFLQLGVLRQPHRSRCQERQILPHPTGLPWARR